MSSADISAREIIALRDSLRAGTTLSGTLPPVPKEQGELILTSSFVQRIYDSYLDGSFDVLEQRKAEIQAWPGSVKLKLHMGGDGGSYCESATYYAWATLHRGRAQLSRYELAFSSKQAFLNSLNQVIDRVCKMAPLLSDEE